MINTAMSPLVKTENIFNRFSDAIGNFSAVLLLLLVLNIFYDVIMRYVFNDVSIGMQELEWHLYSLMFLLGIAYSLKTNSHVRVDFIYDQLSPGKRAVIDIGGTLFFLLPFGLLVTYYGIGFAHESYSLGERSGDPGGLPYRWLIKSAIPLSFICVMISSIGFMLRALNSALGLHPSEHEEGFLL